MGLVDMDGKINKKVCKRFGVKLKQDENGEPTFQGEYVHRMMYIIDMFCRGGTAKPKDVRRIKLATLKESTKIKNVDALPSDYDPNNIETNPYQHAIWTAGLA